MKRLIGLLVVLAVVLLVGGCSFSKTYYYAYGGTVNGYCQEVSTNNSTIESIVTLGGYTLGTCASQGFTGHSCSFSYGAGTTAYDVTEYWGSAVTPSTMQSDCAAEGGTYK